MAEMSDALADWIGKAIPRTKSSRSVADRT
jgi:hypothetical protein